MPIVFLALLALLGRRMAVAKEVGSRMKLPLLILLSAACLQATNYYVTVAGLGGEQDYEQRFEGWAQELDKAFTEAGGDARVETLYGDRARRETIDFGAREDRRRSQARRHASR